MPSLPKFLKSKKNATNKENVPNKRNSDLAQSSKEAHSDSKQFTTYVANPYDVVSAPKTTRATQSWACGPSHGHLARDSHSMINTPINASRQASENQSFRHYENLERNSQHRVNQPLSNKSLASWNGNSGPRHGSFKNRHEYYDDCAESEEDDLCEENDMLKERVYDLQTKLAKVTSELKQSTRSYERDLDYYIREIDKEVYRSRKLSSKLKRANIRVKELEEQLSMRDQMYFMGLYNSTQQAVMSASGAGEALCVAESADIRELTNADTPSVMCGGHIEHEDQDEVRIFRKLDDVSDYEHLNDDSCLNMNAQNKAKHDTHVANTFTPKLNRSLSDSNVHSISITPDEARHIEHSSSSWDRGTVRYGKNSRRYRAESEATTDTSSEDGRAMECYRQLKKKGEVVQYKPPRRQINQKYYKKFGKGERSALADLDFLQNMSSDFSQIMSSPDANRHFNISKQL